MVSVPIEALTAFMTDVLESAGMDRATASIGAACFAEADASGVTTHGAARLAAYHAALLRGAINATPDIRVETEASFVRVDGDNGLGPVVATHLTRAAIAVTREHGMCFATARRSNHFGIASYYADMAAREGMVAIVFSNAAPTVAPFGGREPRIGTNPIAMAAPAGDTENGFSLDMATSVVSRGRLRQMGGDSTPVPSGWAVRTDGQPARTVGEVMAGALHPFGDARGSGLATFTDLIAGVLSNASFGSDVGTMYRDTAEPAGTGHAMIFIDAQRALGAETWPERFDAFARNIRQSQPDAAHDAVLLPGDRREKHRSRSLREGVEIGETTWRSLQELSRSTAIPLPVEMEGSTA